MKKNIFTLLISSFITLSICSQVTKKTIEGTVINDATDKILTNVHIINLNSIKGTITNKLGKFKINASVNDTLYFSHLGFKPLKARVTNDWMKYGNVKVKLTEYGIALEEVVISSNKLTGFLEIDSKNIPIYNNRNRYAIAGIEQTYEGGSKEPNAINRAVKSILNPVNSIYNIFNKKSKQFRKLRKIKKDDEIRNLLQDKFDRETLITLLQIEKIEIDDILRRCKYSKQFITTANDLQILDAINECFEEFKILNRK